MKKLPILLFSLLISFNSYGEWTKITEGQSGNVYYLDLDKIKVNNGYVYYWYMSDFLLPKDGLMSMKVYNQGDCGVGRYKDLTAKFFSESMGMGVGMTHAPIDDWHYPGPDTALRTVFDYICNQDW